MSNWPTKSTFFFSKTEIAFKEDVAGDSYSVLAHKHHCDTNRIFPIDTGLAVQRHFPLRDKRDLFPAWYFSLTSSAVGQKMSLLGFRGSCSSSSIQKAPLALEKEMLSVPFPLFLSCHLSRLFLRLFQCLPERAGLQEPQKPNSSIFSLAKRKRPA